MDARECDPWAQPGMVTAESRKRQMPVRGERTQGRVILTVRGR